MGRFSASMASDEWQTKTLAPNGKLLVAVTSLRFGELPDLFGLMPRLEHASMKHELLGQRMKLKLGSFMDQLQTDNPNLHHLITSNNSSSGSGSANNNNNNNYRNSPLAILQNDINDDAFFGSSSSDTNLFSSGSAAAAARKGGSSNGRREKGSYMGASSASVSGDGDRFSGGSGDKISDYEAKRRMLYGGGDGGEGGEGASRRGGGWGGEVAGGAAVAAAVLVTAEAAVLAEGVSTALDWFKQHLVRCCCCCCCCCS
jgi:hypothetical protein